jgi:putative cell wall-binding protein
VTSTSATRRRLTLLASTSALAAAAPGLAAGTAHATSGGPTLTETLSTAQSSRVDNQGNLYTVPPKNGGPVDVTVTVGAVPNGGAVTLLEVDCGDSVVVSSIPADGVVHCDFPAAGTYKITLAAAVNNVPGLSTSRTAVISSPPGTGVDRFDGQTRYGTGVAVSQAAFPGDQSADAVVLARGDGFADALAGIPLARAKNGPLLLTEGGADAAALTPAVKTELTRVLPADGHHVVYILGGTGAVSQAVQDQVTSLGYSVIRLWGQTRYDTALAVATDPRALDDPGEIVVARGDDFADALASGPFASNADRDSHGVPAAVVLSSGTGTAAALTGLTAGYVATKLAAREVIAVGGGAAAAVAKLPGSAGHYTPIVGADRYDTAMRVAATGWSNSLLPPKPMNSIFVGVATGQSSADALTGGAFMALVNGPLLLTPTAPTVDPSTLAALKADSSALREVCLFGGPGVVPDPAGAQIYTTVGATRSQDYNVPF